MKGNSVVVIWLKASPLKQRTRIISQMKLAFGRPRHCAVRGQLFHAHLLARSTFPSSSLLARSTFSSSSLLIHLSFSIGLSICMQSMITMSFGRWPSSLRRFNPISPQLVSRSLSIPSVPPPPPVPLPAPPPFIPPPASTDTHKTKG